MGWSVINNEKLDLIEYLDNVVRDVDRIFIVLHRRADLDSYVSGYVLWKYLRRLYNKHVNIKFVFPDGISQSMSDILSPKLFEVPSVEDPDITDSSLVMFVDVGGPGVLAEYSGLLEGSGIKVLIDHHTVSDMFKGKFDAVFVDSEASSAVEIILGSLLKRIELEELLDKDEVEAVVMALLAETRFLQLARWDTLELLANILRRYHLDTRLSHFMSRMRKDMDISEKLAVLKAFQRLTIYRCGSHILAVTNIGAFHSTVSSKLISSGVDVAIVYSSEDNCKIHIRISDQLYEKTKIDVVKDIISVIKAEIGGSGGGHAQIGSIELPTEICSSELNKVLLRILGLLREKGLEFTRV